MDRTLETLLVEDSLIDEKIITKMLSSSKDPIVNVSVCQTLQTAFLYLSEHPIDLVFLDLSLPDSYGIDTYINLKHHFPDIPVIILTGMENENASIKAIQHGAQDYLIKKEITSSLLVRSMRYAIERFRLMQEMKRLSLKDDLTGLLNRRGFQILGDQLIKTAQRTRKQLFVAFSDLDGLKAINDEYGHDDGDRALVLMGQVLRKVLRDSDLVARWGGDEFVAMGLFEDTDTPL
ncbi:MAG: diguanylate cyclase, partial [Thermotogae bacterium]|nr:diguanylate cyclase [Thermotogota bacterium]